MSACKINTRFTVIVPTRERCDTLIHTLNTILVQDYDNFEVIVSDNVSNDGTRELVMRLREQDSRISYLNTGQRVSMSENWEFALKNLKDGWVTVLGDDDGLLPGALSRVDQIIKKTGLKAIRSNGCSYSWPSLLSSTYGSMSISRRTGFVIRSSGHMLQKVLDGKCAYNELPVLYNGGFIAASLLNEARDKSGKIFNSMTPDVYSGIVLSYLTEKYCYCYEPLAINGASAHSTGTAGFEGIVRKRGYDPVEKFYSESNIPFHPNFPLLSNGKPVRSIYAVVYEAFMQAKSFHRLKAVQISSEKQLRIILLHSGPDHDEIMGWAKLFADKNYIDLNKIKISKIESIFKRVSIILAKISNGLTRIKINGGTYIPMRNVFEAALFAGLIHELSPSFFQAVKFRLKSMD